MTLTKYQRGDKIEGWNDLPPIMMSRNNSSTSIMSKSRPSRSVNSRSSSFVDISGTLPPSNTSNGSLNETLASSKVPPPVQNQDIGSEEVLDLIDQILKLPSNLPERELSHYEQKLTTQIKTLPEVHLQFIYSIGDEILSYIADASVTKQQIQKKVLEYMILNDGVSAWCSPLKKVVLSLK